jgi:hypothetical protein
VYYLTGAKFSLSLRDRTTSTNVGERVRSDQATGTVLLYAMARVNRFVSSMATGRQFWARATHYRVSKKVRTASVTRSNFSTVSSG